MANRVTSSVVIPSEYCKPAYTLPSDKIYKRKRFEVSKFIFFN